MVAFGFLGIETVSVTAYEARSSKSLRFPSQTMAYIVLLLYFLCMLGQCLNVSWTNDHLPLIYGGIGEGSTDTKDLSNPRSSSLTIIALWIWNKKPLAGFLNGAMIFSVLSSSNTSLYIASRTLYGIAENVPTTSWLGRLLHSFAVVVPKTGVPARALIVSAVAFIWLPFINLKKGYAVQYVSSHCLSALKQVLTFSAHRNRSDILECGLPNRLGRPFPFLPALLPLAQTVQAAPH